MLSKEVCKKCINDFYPNGWKESDEHRWANGYVWCPIQAIGITSFKGAFCGCKYKLEHTVMEEEDVK